MNAGIWVDAGGNDLMIHEMQALSTMQLPPPILDRSIQNRTILEHDPCALIVVWYTTTAAPADGLVRNGLDRMHAPDAVLRSHRLETGGFLGIPLRGGFANTWSLSTCCRRRGGCNVPLWRPS